MTHGNGRSLDFFFRISIFPAGRKRAEPMIRIALLSLLAITPASTQSVPRILLHRTETVSCGMTMDSGSVCDREPRRTGDTSPAPAAYCIQQNLSLLRQEPPPGTLAAGARVYVNDGKCPKGQIKEITGGSNIGRGGEIIKSGSPRQRRCVKPLAPYRCPT
jgi:hypothetical protein